MNIFLSDKLTVQPVCLVQGESKASTIIFNLPREHRGCKLAELDWQVRGTNQKTLLFMAENLSIREKNDDSFCLDWVVGGEFTHEAGCLQVTLVGSSAQKNDMVAKFVIEGFEVLACADGDAATRGENYFESAILETGKNAAVALEMAELAGKWAKKAEDSANNVQAMQAEVYDPYYAKQDIFAIINGLAPVYTGNKLEFKAGTGRVAGVAVLGSDARQEENEASFEKPSCILGVKTAGINVNGRAVDLTLTSPLYCAQNTRTGQMLQDERWVDGREKHVLACKTFTGTENFVIWGVANATTEFASEGMDVFTLANSETMPTALCSHFSAPLTPGQLWSAAVAGFSASHRILMRTQHKTVEEFKAWLAKQFAAGTPVQVVYQRSSVLSLEKADAGLVLAEGEHKITPQDPNATVRVIMKRIFEK